MVPLPVPAPVPVPATGRREGRWHVPDDGLASRSARARGSGRYESTTPAQLASGGGLGIALPGDLAAQLDEDRERLAGVRRHALAWQVLPLLVSRPMVNAAHLQRQLGTSAMSFQRALAQLTGAGVLQEATGRTRIRVWQHPGILAVLDDCAARVRRQG